VRNRISRRDTAELFRELFGARICAGSIAAIVGCTPRALKEPYEELLCHIRAAPAINVDETGWRLRGGKRTLWGALTLRAAVFRIAPDRHQREAQALLGDDFATHRLLRSLVGLRLPRRAAAAVLLGASGARLHGPE
jgi:hypothetical protein